MNLPWIKKCIDEYSGVGKDQEKFVKKMANNELAAVKEFISKRKRRKQKESLKLGGD